MAFIRLYELRVQYNNAKIARCALRFLSVSGSDGEEGARGRRAAGGGAVALALLLVAHAGEQRVRASRGPLAGQQREERREQRAHEPEQLEAHGARVARRLRRRRRRRRARRRRARAPVRSCRGSGPAPAGAPRELGPRRHQRLVPRRALELSQQVARACITACERTLQFCMMASLSKKPAPVGTETEPISPSRTVRDANGRHAAQRIQLAPILRRREEQEADVHCTRTQS